MIHAHAEAGRNIRSAAEESSEEEYALKQKIKELSREKPVEILSKVTDILSEEQHLDIEEYEDDSSGHWDSDWVTDYYDNQGIGEKLMSAIRFAKDCVEDRRYAEAHLIYE